MTNKNPFTKPYPYWHQTTIGRLASILKHGLLAPAHAKNLGFKNYRRNFYSSWSADTVSLLTNTNPRKTTARSLAILIDPNTIETLKPNFLTEDTNRPIEDEALVADSIPPEKFIGIVIGEVGYSFKLEKPVKPKPINLNRILTEIAKANINFTLPIYFKGKQIYPE